MKVDKYYLVKEYPQMKMPTYYLTRSGHTRVELPNCTDEDAQWTLDECQAVDKGHRYVWVPVRGIE